MSDQGAFWLLLILGVCVTVGTLVWWGVEKSRLVASQNWPSVMGEVVHTEIGQTTGKYTRYAPVVRYRYQVDGRVLESRRIWAADIKNYRNPAEAQAFLNSYPVGTPVRVYYDPDSPETAALIQDGRTWPILIGFPAGFLILGCAWYLRHAAWGDKPPVRPARRR